VSQSAQVRRRVITLTSHRGRHTSRTGEQKNMSGRMYLNKSSSSTRTACSSVSCLYAAASHTHTHTCHITPRDNRIRISISKAEGRRQQAYPTPRTRTRTRTRTRLTSSPCDSVWQRDVHGHLRGGLLQPLAARRVREGRPQAVGAVVAAAALTAHTQHSTAQHSTVRGGCAQACDM
jgi:hypothetical protein